MLPPASCLHLVGPEAALPASSRGWAAWFGSLATAPTISAAHTDPQRGLATGGPVGVGLGGFHEAGALAGAGRGEV